MMPVDCPGVPSEILNPAKTWPSEQEYEQKANELHEAFIQNFKQFEEPKRVKIPEEVLKLC
jgi:phosphoenolpyruvate carboxykinase (ATP)